MGVMNGTCNYILTRMQSANLTYGEAFAEADGLGYLEADPTLMWVGLMPGTSWRCSVQLPLAQR